MAIVQTSGLISDIRGSVGGSTFQRSASGLTMRTKPVPVGRGSNAQQGQRNIIAQLNFLWGSMTVAQRQQWSSFAIFTNGVGKTNRQRNSANTGKTQFIAVNSWLLIYSKFPVLSPTIITPNQQAIPCPPFFDQSDNLGKTTYDLDTASEILVVQVSLPQSVGTNTSNTGFRTLVYTMVDGTTQEWAASYLAQFGVPLQLGKRYWVQLIVVNYITGAISPKAKALVLYTATPSLGIGLMVIGSTFIVA
jgi:hypothetical protein